MNVDLIPADEPDDEEPEDECLHEWNWVQICQRCGVSGYVKEPDMDEEFGGGYPV